MPKRNEDGTPIVQSNTRIIKWSDGTFGLAVGSELFDVDEILNNDADDNGAEEAKETTEGPMDSSKEYLYLLNQKDVDEDGEEDADVNKTMLECISSLKSKLIPRPSSLKSSAHKNFVLQERQRNLKRARIEEFVTFADPEKEKMDRIRNNEDLAKQQTRGGGAPRRSMGGGGGKRRGGRSYADEDEEGYDSVNIRKLKKGVRRNGMDNDDNLDDYGDDGIDSEDEDEWSKRKKTGFEKSRASGRRANDKESSDEEEFEMDEDDDEEIAVRKKASKSAGFFDDDSE
jgi:RNA polymerase-associated protein LEO1